MLKKPTIAFVANTAWSMYNFRKGVMERLIKEGYAITVIAPPDGYEQYFENMGISFYPLNTIRNKGKNPFHDLQLIKELRSLYKQIRPALIFHYTIKPNIYGTIAAAHCGIPSIAVTTGLGHVFTHKHITSLVVKKLYWYALRGAKEVWFLNREDQQTFLHKRIIRAEKSFLLHGEGINTSVFVSSGNHVKKEESKTFILVARLIYDKGVKEFVEASAILKQKGYRFTSQVLGFLDVENPEAISKEQVNDWVSKGLIEYLGVTSNVIPYIDSADCMVLPSYYGEGIPRTLMEAASLSKPIITTNNVGCKEVVDDGITGYLCEIKNTEDLASKMEIILNLQDNKLVEMGAAGRRKMISQFDESIVVSKYISTISRYISF